MTYLDTHVVIWLYDGKVEQLSQIAAQHIQNDSLFISPAVVLELEYLHEVRRLTRTSQTMIASLSAEIGLAICELSFAKVVESALHQKWKRDPFDRLIVAHAAANDAVLITKDERIHRHYKRAVW